MIRMSSAFELAYARWRGEPEIGPAKAPAAADDLDRAFTEWESAAFDRMALRTSARLVETALADFDDAPTEVFPRT